MIVGFSRHGTGCGSGPVDYVTDKARPGREESPPVVLRGSPDDTRTLIDSLEFKYRYTSGVLSFAPGETITPDMEQTIMDRFERLAFAGMEPDQYNILWVRHSHAGHHELHFVTPRVELSTGKSFNIRPPGEAAKRAFDDFRSEINARYGLADPDDPNRARDISQPDHELKIAAEALRRGEKPTEDIRVLLDTILSQRAVQGLIRSRSDVMEHVADLGFAVTREGKNYITVADEQSGHRWRMKGGLYEREFDATGAIEAAAPGTERDYSEPDEGAADRFAQRVERHIKQRAEYHAGRYAKADQSHVAGTQPAQKGFDLAPDCQPGINTGPDSSERLDCYLAERLGSVYMAGIPDKPELADAPEAREGARYAGPGRWENPVEPLRGAETALFENRRELGDVREGWRKLQNTAGVLTNDRAGNTFTQRLEELTAGIRRAAARIIEGAERLSDRVRAYCTGRPDDIRASQLLDESCRRIVRANGAFQEPLQAEQALRQAQEERLYRQIAAARPAPKPRYRGPSM
ncbi:relaxase/mobilization nuclease domain-containing protein [Salmonella enterica]|nr:relaxase/mobilization nuclease [Salmonella enterica subsp. diarizonae serovar 61:l,[v],[z13]:1,5,[7]]EJR4720979.1 relaxase/mobilization nuclease domain-containing protein [Salmonella enterica]